MEEEDAAATTGKRIKRDRIDGQWHLQTGNSAAAGDQSLDFIGRLPDEVLCTIISLLDLKEGGRTQILSRRWRPLWRASPLRSLDVDCRHLSTQERKRTAFASKILSVHLGPTRRFSLPGMRLRDRYAKIDGWLRSRALTGLEQIQFSYEIEDRRLGYPLPPSALRFASTLRVAEFGNCDFPTDIALRFPCLKRFTLRYVFVLEDDLHSLLSGCPVLESLLLHGNVGVGCLRINSPTLRSIGVSASSFCRGRVENPIVLQEVIIEDAPCLEMLFPDHGPAAIRILRAPKLEILGELSDHITKLQIGTTVFQKMIALSLTTSMRTVKVLALNTWGPNLDSAVDLLKCFPCLQKLYISSQVYKDRDNKRSYNPLDPIECLESHLRQVVLMNYMGMRPDVDFAKFFVLNAKVLQKMVLGCIGNCSDKWVDSQQRRLQLDNRASQGAQFKFKRGCGLHSFGGDNSTHCLGIDDPFDSFFCNA